MLSDLYGIQHIQSFDLLNIQIYNVHEMVGLAHDFQFDDPTLQSEREKELRRIAYFNETETQRNEEREMKAM